MKKEVNVALLSPQAIASDQLVKRLQPPLGLLHIAAVLEENGVEPLIIDALVEGYDNEEKIEDSLNLYKYGQNDKLTAEKVAEFQTDVVGISALFSSQIECALSLAKEIKTRLPHCLVVMGGNHASNEAENLIKDHHFIDVVVKGEGEYVFSELVDRLAKGQEILDLPGLVFLEEGRLKSNPKSPMIKDMDSLPFPAWHLVPMEKYFEIGMPHNPYTKSNRVACIMTSRGCPAACYFCSSPEYFGTAFRAMSSDRTVEMIKYVVERFNVKELQIEDDTFTLNSKRVMRICKEIEHLNLRITLPNAVRADAPKNRVQRLELFHHMKAAGVAQLAISVEHGDQEFLSDIVGKGLDLEEVKATCNLAHEAGLLIHANFMMGFPYETAEHRQKSIDFARTLDADSFSISLATPLPGTKMWDIVEQNNLFSAGFNINQVLFSEVNIRPEDISGNELLELVTSLNKELNTKAMERNPNVKEKYKLFKGKTSHGDRKYLSAE